MILKPITLTLTEKLKADDKYLPLSQADSAKLLAHVPDGEEMFLTIEDNLRSEYIKIENQCGTIVITERGVDSTAEAFPKGSCVKFEASIPVIKWLVCNYDCCKGKCDCEAVEIQRSSFPSGKTGEQYAAWAIYNGSGPINFTVAGTPSWMEIHQEDNRITITGTPTAAAVYTISISATNCMGRNIITHQFVVHIF